MWRSVVGYEGLYEVSDQGEVRSLDRWARCGKGGKGRRWVPGQIMTYVHTLNGGHKLIRLSDGRRSRPFLVHHLVLEAFVGPRPEGKEGLHWDDIPANNSLTNLRWGTRSENKYDSVRNGGHNQIKKTQCPRGHEYTVLPYEPNRRRCLTCKNDANRRYRLRKKAA